MNTQAPLGEAQQHPGRYLSKLILPETKKAFAAKLGVTRQTLHSLLSERQRVEPAMAERLAKATGVPQKTWLLMQIGHDAARVEQRYG